MTPLTWNADRQRLADGRARTQFGVGWRNYQRGSDPWRAISGEVQSDLTVAAFPGSVEFPASSQGECDILVDGGFSMKRYVDEGNGSNPEPEFSMSLQTLCEHNVTGVINPDNPNQVLYSNAWDSAHLRYGIWHARSCRIEKVVEIHSMPAGTGDIEYQFRVRSSKATVLAGSNHDVSPWDESGAAELNNADAFISLQGSPLRGAVLRTPVAWYYAAGEMVRVPIRVTFAIESSGESVIATKHIPRALVTQALSAGSSLFTDATFTPDANPESSSVDGYTSRYSSSSTWSSITTSAGTYAASDETDNPLLVAANGITSDRYDQTGLVHTLFDTSSLDSGHAVDTADLTVVVDRLATNSLGLDWNVYSSSPASNTDIGTGDHDSVGTVPFSTARDCSAESTDWTSVTFSLNDDGKAAIPVDGVAKFAFAHQENRENGTYGDPNWVAGQQEKLQIRLSEYTGTADDPSLVVETSAAGGSATCSGSFGNAISIGLGV